MPPVHPLRITFPALVRLKGKLTSTEPLMRKVGAVLVAGAQQAFAEEKFGDFRWPGRYPNQSEPMVNFAGAVSDFAKGTWNLPNRRFERRPAGRDKGTLLQSLTPSRAVAVRGKFVVEVGSVVPEAAITQWGGESKQTITPTVLINLARFMKAQRKTLKRLSHGRLPKKGIFMAAAKAVGAQKLGALFQKDELVTHVNARPYLGITDDIERKVRAVVEEFFKGAA